MTLSVQNKRLQAGFQSFTTALPWVLHLGRAHRPLFQNVGSLKTDVLLHPAFSESHLRSRLPRTATISHSAHRVPVSNFGVRKPLFSVQTKADSPSSLRPNPSGQAHGATCHFLVSATGERGKEQWAGRGQVPAGPQMPRAPPWVGDWGSPHCRLQATSHPWLPSPETHRRPDHLPTKTLGSGIGGNIIYYFESELPDPAGDRGGKETGL